MRLLVLSALLMTCELPGWPDAATGAETGKEQPNFRFRYAGFRRTTKAYTRYTRGPKSHSQGLLT